MKHYLLLPLVLIGFAVSAQKYNAAESRFLADQKGIRGRCPDCPCHARPPWTIIMPGFAQGRIEIYKLRMKHTGLPLADDVTYNIDGAIDLLQKMSANSGYDGFRAYFAMYPCQQPSTKPDSGYTLVPNQLWGKLTLIYVPTTRGDIYVQNGKKYRRHIDDILHCMIIGDNAVVTLPAKYASMWIHKAQCTLLDSLEHFRQKKLKHFHETHSLWYDMKYVGKNCLENGLLNILTCRKCCKTKYVYVRFSAFLTSHSNQLTVIFQLDSGKTRQFVSLYSADMSRRAAKQFEHCYGKDVAATSGGSDTGKPCPPPSPCGTNVGALLPNQ